MLRRNFSIGREVEYMRLSISALLITVALLLSSCNGKQASEAAKSPAPPASQAQPASAPNTQPAQASSSMATNSATAPAGPPATEKYRLNISNYTGTPVTVSLNGTWVGQWDSGQNVPLDGAIQGKNTLTLETPKAPDGDLTVSVSTQRGNEGVTLLSANLRGKTGTQTYAFVGK